MEGKEKLTGMKKFKARCLEVAGGDMDKVEITEKFAELELDFEFVKNMNTELANKYQELMNCFPLATELQVIIEHIDGKSSTPLSLKYDKEYKTERLQNLLKFQSALFALEKQDPSAKPVKYDDLVKG